MRKLLCIVTVAGLLGQVTGIAEKITPSNWGSRSKIDTGNNSFEKVKSNHPLNWGTNSGIAPRGILTVKTDNAADGAHYIQIANAPNQLYHLYTDRGFYVKGGDTFRMSVFVRGKGSFKLALYGYSAGNAMIDCLEPQTAKIDSDKWIRKVFKIVVPDKEYPGKGKIVRANIAIVVDRNSTLQFDNFKGVTEQSLTKASAPRIIPGSNTDPESGKPGEVPYEMAGRKERRKPLVTFADASLWAVECYDAEAALYRTNERRLFRDWCGKLVYRPTGPKTSVIVRLKKPVIIPEPWDCINAWNWGNVWCWISDKENRPLEISALISGADGEKHEIKLGKMYYEYWHLMHRKLLQKIVRPATFIGFRITNLTNRNKSRSIYLGPVAFYKQSLKKLSFEKWPEKLPFPTRKDTILPHNKTENFKNSVQMDGNIAVFKYLGADTKLQYCLNLEEPFLNGLEAVCKNRRIKFCDGAHILLANGRAKLQLVQKKMNNGVLSLEWNCISGAVSTLLAAELKIKQKSLIITFHELSQNGKIAKLMLGRATGLTNPELIQIPYVSYGWNYTDPHLLRDGKLFVFSHFDWYVSDASILIGADKMGKNWAQYNGGVGYIPKTDGKRNPLRERLFLTVSPDVQEVFPTIPNPVSTMREKQCRRMWRTKGGGNYTAESGEAKRLRALGMNQVTIRYHEQQWRDTGESYTFKLNAAPKRGGNAALKKLVSDVQSLGWLVGLYTNYTDFAPVNSFWNEDYVAHTADDNWRDAWCRCYLPKPMFAVEMEAKLAPQIKAKFGTSHVYCDVKTAVPPSDYVDFDARVPGAATFRRTFECFGRLLYNESFAYNGPVYSEGGCHWMYAGLTDGNYGQMFGINATAQPFFPDFDLLKIHPLEMDAGIGDPGMFNRGNNGPLNYKQFIATTLAYGHIGVLGAGQNDARLMELYYMLQPLQEYYVMVPVKSIAYECKGRMLDTSAAIVDGGWRDSRLQVVYKNGFSVWVNGSKKPWTVDTGKTGMWTLPTWGFAAWTKDGRIGSVYAQTGAVVGNCLLNQNRSIQFNCGSDSYYFNASKGFVYGKNLAGDGAAVLKKESSGWELIPARKFKEFGFSPALTGLAGKNIRAVAVNEAGDSLGTVKIRQSRDMVWFVEDAPAGTFKYRLEAAGDAVEKSVSCKDITAAKGRKVVLASADSISSAEWFDSNGKSYPAELTKTGTSILCNVPKEFADGSHVWLKLNLDDRIEWLDFVAIEPFSAAIELSQKDLTKGSPYKVKLVLTNRLEQAKTIELASRANLNNLPAGIEVPANSRKSIRLVWNPGAAKGKLVLQITAQNDKITQTAELKISKIVTVIKTGNDSFEKTDSDSALKWGTNRAFPPVGKLSVETGEAHDGNKFLSFVNKGAQTHQLYTEKSYAATGGDVVNMSIFAKGKGSFKLALYAYSSRMIDCLEPESAKVNSGKWVRKNFKIVIPGKMYPPYGKITKVNVAIIVDKNSNIQLDSLSGYIESLPKVLKK
jgi:hypothetical protein